MTNAEDLSIVELETLLEKKKREKHLEGLAEHQRWIVEQGYLECPDCGAVLKLREGKLILIEHMT